MRAASPTAYETSYRLLCEVLRGVLRNAVQARPGAAGGIGSVGYRAVATLYMLLMAHPVDRRGRCRSCRYPGAVFGRRWRRCRVYGEASVWLRQPAEFVGAQLARELGLVSAEPLSGDGTAREEPADRMAPADLEDTDVLPWSAQVIHSLTTSQSPVVPPAASLPGGFPQAGRPVPDHGGIGDRPERPGLAVAHRRTRNHPARQGRRWSPECFGDQL